jgi:hypothetical protein
MSDTGISPGEYQAERRKLQRELEAAESARDAAEYAFRCGRISESEAQDARGAVTRTEAQIRGLEAAYRESLRLEDASAEAERRESIRAAVAEVKNGDASCAAAFHALVKALLDAGAHVREYEEAREQMANAARRGGAKPIGDFIETLNNNRREADYLEAVLFNAGFGLFRLGSKEAALRARDSGLDADVLCSQRSRSLLGFVEEAAEAALNPDEVEP